jgi:hypothetical protein
MSQNTLMSQVKHSARALSTPDLAMWRVMFWMDCAVAEARPEDVGEQACMGQFLSRGRVLSILLSLSFFVRPGAARFFIPTFRVIEPARAGAVKNGA